MGLTNADLYIVSLLASVFLAWGIFHNSYFVRSYYNPSCLLGRNKFRCGLSFYEFAASCHLGGTASHKVIEGSFDISMWIMRAIRMEPEITSRPSIPSHCRRGGATIADVSIQECLRSYKPPKSKNKLRKTLRFDFKSWISLKHLQLPSVYSIPQ